MTYAEKLLDPRWQRKRLEVLERDGWACQKCGDAKATLHVHHFYYDRGADPWDYPAEALVTLCDECHEQETEVRTQAENMLLDTLRRARFTYDNLESLAVAFKHWKLPAQMWRRDCCIDGLTFCMCGNEPVDFELVRDSFGLDGARSIDFEDVWRKTMAPLHRAWAEIGFPVQIQRIAP